MKGGWQQDELGAELGVSPSAISKFVKDCKASTSDHPLQGLLSCEYLRPTSGTTPRVETRGNRRRIGTGSALANAARQSVVGRYGYLGFATDTEIV